MRIKNLNNTAFSLMEILLSSIIFVISIAGVFATLNAVRAPVANKESALTAAVFSKQVLEALRSSVNEQSSANFYVNCGSTCTDFSLALGTHNVSQATLSGVGLSWPTSALSAANGNVLTYTVSCADGTCATPEVAHKVVLNIHY